MKKYKANLQQKQTNVFIFDYTTGIKKSHPLGWLYGLLKSLYLAYFLHLHVIQFYRRGAAKYFYGYF